MQSFRVNKGKRDADLNVHVNLAPMIDFLVVVIAYLLVTASFYSIQYLESSLTKESVSSNPSPASATSQHVVNIRLGAGGTINLSFQGEVTAESQPAPMVHETIQGQSGAWPVEELVKKTKEWHAARAISSIKLSSEGKVRYGQVVTILSRLRQVVPEVSLNLQ